MWPLLFALMLPLHAQENPISSEKDEYQFIVVEPVLATILAQGYKTVAVDGKLLPTEYMTDAELNTYNDRTLCTLRPIGQNRLIFKAGDSLTIADMDDRDAKDAPPRRVLLILFNESDYGLACTKNPKVPFTWSELRGPLAGILDIQPVSRLAKLRSKFKR